MKRIGVLTSGGDAPGMNPAIRAVVRTAIGMDSEVFGIRRGYMGLCENDISILTSRDVGGIINHGGTFLRSIRFSSFRDKEVRRQAYENLKKNRIDGLIVIGGDGSACGAYALDCDFGFPVAVIPASIDNDLYGTEMTVGFDTAVNTAVEATDRIRDTATSHERIFIIEVMGKEKGNLALEVAVASGAEIVILPEVSVDWENIFGLLREQGIQGKKSSLIILAEGAGSAPEVAEILKKQFPGKEIRYSVLGYIQRGGSPSSCTRILATRFGVEAVKMLKSGIYGYMVGISEGKIKHVPLKEVVSMKKPISQENLEFVRLMSI